MSLKLWKSIDPSDDAMCAQFVKVMQLMDPRYRSLKVSQFQSWLINNAKATSGDLHAAFAWFPREEDQAIASRMQIVVLGRHADNARSAELVMLGWTPGNPDCQPDVLDIVIDEILEKGVEWLSTLKAGSPVKQVSAVRPDSIANEQVKALHDRIYVRSIVGPDETKPYLRLVREQRLSDAAYWLLQLVP